MDHSKLEGTHVLVTGTGEVGTRVQRTCERMGLTTTRPEEGLGNHTWLPHTRTVMDMAQASGATAVHPGFVSPTSRWALAKATRESGITFIAPSTRALEYMQDKLAMRRLAQDLGLRTIPGSVEPLPTVERALQEAEALGYPVVLKPTDGTAGVGIEVVHGESEMAEAWQRAERAATEAFGVSNLYLEKLLERCRHLEVTVFADSKGNCATLGERECSIQRRFQVLIAESPSPMLLQHSAGDEIREALWENAMSMARALNLSGVATFEFLFDKHSQAHFLEANADMHGAIMATEMLTGLDPIEIQVGNALDDALVPQTDLLSTGHAFEARICAETPDPLFTRVEGKVERMRFPPAPYNKIRFTPGINEGDHVGGNLEPLLARVGTHAAVRHQALLNLDRALAETSILPLENNIRFLRRVLNHDSYTAGQFDCDFANQLVGASRRSRISLLAPKLNTTPQAAK